MTRDEAIAYFELLERLFAAASTDWQHGDTGQGEGLLARIIPQHAPTPVVVYDPHIDRNDIALLTEFYPGFRFLLTLVRSLRRRLDTYEPPASPEPPAKPYSPAQNCGKYCNDQAFQRWLHEVHGLDHPWDSHRAATKVRSLLGIDSRTDLDTNPEAAERWHAMRGIFKEWMKT